MEQESSHWPVTRKTKHLFRNVYMIFYLARDERKTSVKWYRVLGSLKYWAILIATFGYYWSIEAILIYSVLPTRHARL